MGCISVPVVDLAGAGCVINRSTHLVYPVDTISLDFSGDNFSPRQSASVPNLPTPLLTSDWLCVQMNGNNENMNTSDEDDVF